MLVQPRLRPAQDAPPGALENRRVVLPFDPARDGFSFPNHFLWQRDDLDYVAPRLAWGMRAALGALGAVAGGLASGRAHGALGGAAASAALAAALGLDAAVMRGMARRWSSFGLCGGMALAAAERWAPGTPPSLPTAALAPDNVRALLRRRQEATLRASLPRFAGYWLLARLAPGFAEYPPLAGALADELERLEVLLRDGRPAVVGLVGDAPDPFALHQVVAFGIERTNGALGATLHVYDPNAPGRTRFIHTGPAPGREGCVSIRTDIPTGRTPGGSAHIATRPGQLTMLFVIDPRS